MKSNAVVLFLSVPLIVLAVTSLSCGTRSNESPPTTSAKGAPRPDAAAGRASASSSPAAGWKGESHEDYTFFIPPDWQEDQDTDIWCPAEQNVEMGRAPVSLHCGSIPVLPGSSIDERLAFYYGETPQTVKELERCGMTGRWVEITRHGRRHLGLVLIEDVGAAIQVIDFFDCQAPESEFQRRRVAFEMILNSVACD